MFAFDVHVNFIRFNCNFLSVRRRTVEIRLANYELQFFPLLIIVYMLILAHIFSSLSNCGHVIVQNVSFVLCILVTRFAMQTSTLNFRHLIFNCDCWQLSFGTREWRIFLCVFFIYAYLGSERESPLIAVFNR